MIGVTFKRFLLIVIAVFLCTVLNAQSITNVPPYLRKDDHSIQLIVNGKPFIITGGELGNSSASSTEYMQPVWPKLKKMNLNTVLAPVYWELIEPVEGKFDFKLLDELVRDARSNNMKLILLWFGTWKNSMSCYAPGWVKLDQQRFPRTENSKGKTEEIVSPFSRNILEADKKAFVKLMQHIKELDAKQSTVIMIQVENEIGQLPEARDHSAAANQIFSQSVPQRLLDYLKNNRAALLPEIKKLWEDNGAKTTGNWEDVFGKSLATDEVFMSWYFAAFVEEITKAGKQVYNIPMYVNAALNRPGKKPGEYPSAGPLPHVMDIWKAAAPSIDMLSPDFYNPDFKHWNDLYTRMADNPLFIPEHRFEAGVDAKAFYAIGHYKALGFSPFAIEETARPDKEPIGNAYSVIQQLSAEIAKAQTNGTIEGVLLSKEIDTVKVVLGDYILNVSHDLTLGWSSKAKENDWPLTGGIILALSNNEFYVAGTGLVISFKPKTDGLQAGILKVDEGSFVNGQWKPIRRLNGDEDHQGRHLRIPEGETGIQRIKLYSYK